MQVYVIGGGASGMVAAITAARKHHKVTILEQQNHTGHKILATGNGRCNMTNADQSLSHYHGLSNENSSQTLASAVFSRFSYDDTLTFFDELGIVTKNKGGYLYPRSEQASAVADALAMKLQELNVRIICDCAVSEVIQKDRFQIITSKGNFSADRIILATGSYAGTKGLAGYELARQLGHHVIEPLPALVQLTSDASLFKPIAGIRTQGKVTLVSSESEVLGSDTGELQLTAYGLSGIPVFQVSYLASRELSQKRKVNALLDFMPDYDEDSLKSLLMNRKRLLADRCMDQFFVGLLNKNLGSFLVSQSGINLTKCAGELTDQEMNCLLVNLKEFKAPVKGTKSYSDAQICTGGIDVEEIDGNLESKKVSGLYFCGEIIDLNGDCGGYNLQWAWSSGAVAGELADD